MDEDALSTLEGKIAESKNWLDCQAIMVDVALLEKVCDQLRAALARIAELEAALQQVTQDEADLGEM